MLFDQSTLATEVEPAAVSSGVLPARRRRHKATPHLLVHPPDAERGAVEQFIRGVYAQHYDARVGALTPYLVTLEADGEILAAAGYRPATHPLFLERYLAGPVEAVLSALTPDVPARAAIVEVGHLAAVRTGAGRLLMPLLGAHLAQSGFEWVVSTATAELRHLFARMGLEPLVLGVADPAVLGPGVAQWGSYYAHHPLVVAGSIAAGMARIAPTMTRAPA
jgi:hypothetical protein